MNKPSPISKSGFSDPARLPGALAAPDAAALLTALGDVALVLDGAGTILDVATGQGDLSNHGFTAWIGEAWSDTVTIESKPKVAEMLAAARDASARPRWRQVNHPAAGGDVPVDYLTMPLGKGDHLVAVGRDLRGAAAAQQRLLQTQQSLERDYVRLRQIESRYRLLFNLAGEPMMLVDAGTRRIREANPAAHDLLGRAAEELAGEPLAAIADAAAREDLLAYLGAAEAADDVQPLTLRLPAGRGEVRVTARLFREGRTPLFLVRLTPAGDAAPARVEPALADVVERMPDAFVLANAKLVVLSANAAFVELTGAASVARVVGSELGLWLGRPGIDLELIVGQLRDHDAVRNVATILRTAAGTEQEIELSGVATRHGDAPCYGFVIRSVARRLRDAPAIPRDTPRSVEQLTELVGRVSLKDIVRESTDLVERLCIEAALTYTSDNRASAAEILGLSRQSLYSKLHRHGLGNLVASDE